MSEEIDKINAEFIEQFLKNIREDEVRLEKRRKKLQSELDRLKSDTSENYLLSSDLYNGINLIQSRSILNQRLMACLLVSRSFNEQIGYLRNALSKLPAREEFDELRKALKSDSATARDALLQLQDAFKKPEEQDEKLKNEEASINLKDDIRKKHGEHAFG